MCHFLYAARPPDAVNHIMRACACHGAADNLEPRIFHLESAILDNVIFNVVLAALYVLLC